MSVGGQAARQSRLNGPGRGLLAGDLAEADVGEVSMTAVDLLDHVGDAVSIAKRTGAPVGHAVMEEGTVLHMRYAGVPKNSRSPNAGALLIHYLMSAEGQELLWRVDGLDLHLFPGSQTKRELDRVRAAKGKIIINSPEWLASFKDYAAIQKELEGILRQK